MLRDDKLLFKFYFIIHDNFYGRKFLRQKFIEILYLKNNEIYLLLTFFNQHKSDASLEKENKNDKQR